MASNDYITLENSNASLSLKYRVMGGPDSDYNDGMLSKSQEVNRTIGGGIDAAVGAVYRSWNPVIMCRHTEDESGYGTLAQLETFYSYNDPGGTPSNIITFTDHHGGAGVDVIILGDFEKQMLGVSIEGSNAWAHVRLELHEVP